MDSIRKRFPGDSIGKEGVPYFDMHLGWVGQLLRLGAFYRELQTFVDALFLEIQWISVDLHPPTIFGQQLIISQTSITIFL